MLIVCKTCASSYHIPREILDENGCTLRCVGCGETWIVSSDSAIEGGAPIVEGERVPLYASEPGPKTPHLDLPDFSVLENPAADERLGFLVRLARSGKNMRGAVAAVSLLSFGMAAIAARATIVQTVPKTARFFAAIGLPVNLRGLALDNVRTNVIDLGNRKMLVVEGAVVNLRDSATEAPNMRIALRGADHRELYVWTAPAAKRRLEPREQAAFRTRLATPPEGVADVLVRFASAGDKVSPMEDGL